MRAVRLSESAWREIRAHGESTYPDECCGFLVSPGTDYTDSGPRQVPRVVRAANEFEGERRRRFEIRPQELMAAESQIVSTGELLTGFYHSHPDHPARPSQFDTDHAWPWYSYLVLRVDQGQAGEVGAFELQEEGGAFVSVPMEILSGRAKSGATNGGVSESLSASSRVK